MILLSVTRVWKISLRVLSKMSLLYILIILWLHLEESRSKFRKWLRFRGPALEDECIDLPSPMSESATSGRNVRLFTMNNLQNSEFWGTLCVNILVPQNKKNIRHSLSPHMQEINYCALCDSIFTAVGNYEAFCVHHSSRIAYWITGIFEGNRAFRTSQSSRTAAATLLPISRLRSPPGPPSNRAWSSSHQEPPDCPRLVRLKRCYAEWEPTKTFFRLWRKILRSPEMAVPWYTLQCNTILITIPEYPVIGYYVHKASQPATGRPGIGSSC